MSKMKLKDGIVFLNKIILIFLIKLIFLKKSEEFLRLLIKQQKGFFALREMTNLFFSLSQVELFPTGQTEMQIPQIRCFSFKFF